MEIVIENLTVGDCRTALKMSLGSRRAGEHTLRGRFDVRYRFLVSLSAVAAVVAIVSLARQVCLHNRVGNCGDTPGEGAGPITKSAAWEAIQPRLFPSFDVKKFESQAHAYCVEVRREL